MKKSRVKLVTAILGLFFAISFQSSAQNYHFTVNQDTVLMHCDVEDSTFVYLTLSDPNGELTGPFTAQWTINDIVQTETDLFTVDTLHWRDTVIFEVFDASMTSVWLDSTIIYDEDKPEIVFYPGYYKKSHACINTGRQKLNADPYVLGNVIANGRNYGSGGHVILDSLYAGLNQYSYSINACRYNDGEIYIESEPKPELEMHQKYLATCVDGKFNLMLSDSFVIDSVWLNQSEMLLVNDTNYYLHVPGGDNEIKVYAKYCSWYEDFFVESEAANIVTIEDVILPHEGLSTGNVEVSSTIEIKDAWYVMDDVETQVAFNTNAVLYEYLPAGEYIFRVKDAGACITDIEYELLNLTGNPVPTGFSADSIFDFRIDGVPINDVPEIGNQYRLIIHKSEGIDASQLVFDTNSGDALPWNKEVNGEVQHGYFLYYLEITNPKYTGETTLKSYFRLFKVN